jgi:hypothetical protein
MPSKAHATALEIFCASNRLVEIGDYLGRQGYVFRSEGAYAALSFGSRDVVNHP